MATSLTWWDEPVRRLFPPPAEGLPELPEDEVERLHAYPPTLERPWVRTNMVASLDGAISLDGASGGLSGPADRRMLSLFRDLADVVLVGLGTALAEGYRGITATERRTARRARWGLAGVPPLAVVTNSCDVPPGAPLLTDVVAKTIVVTCAAAPEERRRRAEDDGAEVVLAGDARVDPRTLVAELGRRGLRRVCCEGGPQLLGALIEDELVDEFCLTVSPVLAGGATGRAALGSHPPVRRDMTLLSTLEEDGMLFLRYGRRA
ncbi:pyrimidine reductase family protein [Actinoalloteichus caeruleus]|uniref:pyrimidine reductase family protein n=1 Tax=Actinoalloteichus cyanogriseus TaxID=2893586 RepID=UPI001FE11F33|nr:pyrimidine reductase family protein [Actinoalloteichus caeruleus]